MKCIWYIIFSILISCSFPHDSKESWKKAQTKGLVVGVIDNPPFATKQNDTFVGSEIQYINQFAKNNKLQISFYSASASKLMEGLKNYEYSLVIGGIEKNTPWKSEIGLSKPYDSKHVFAIPKGENKLLFNLESFINLSSP